MALTLTFHSGQPREKRGQGAIEAILALPVFLFLICITFQLFFLGIAQIQLQYAAFCAARSGAVNSSDEVEMRLAVKRILAGSSRLITLPDRSFKVEILNTWQDEKKHPETAHQTRIKPLVVRIHWYYPLVVPFADKILQMKNRCMYQGKPCVHLKASWATVTFEQLPEDGSNANNP